MRPLIPYPLGIFIVFCLSINAGGQELDYKGFPEWSWGKKDSSEYYLYTPSNMKPGEKCPVVLFMHGCCGQDYHATLRNAVDPPVRVWHNFGENTQRIPTYIISAKTSRGWRQHFENLKAVIDNLIANQQGDPKRIYVSGFSMGGAGTWEIIEKYPGFFAAALPMGMDFRGENPENYTQIPIWASRGETDWWARHLGKQVATIRSLNGWAGDSSNWVIGVNPRLTTFAGVGHGVMWDAVSSQDLVGWAYAKVNDGNAYPTIFFKSPAYKAEFGNGASVPLVIEATDTDGTIDRVVIKQQGKVIKTLTKAPYTLSVKVSKGDITFEATAYDNLGKMASQSIVLRVDIPVSMASSSFTAECGSFFEKRLQAGGNGAIHFTTGDVLPEGITLDADGLLRGIPVQTGRHQFTVAAADEDGDRQEASFLMTVSSKQRDEVLVTNVRNYAGKGFPIDKVRKGISPHSGPLHGEVTLSGGITAYEGLTIIRPDASDTVNAGQRYLSFDVDEDVVVYIAYEKRDNLFKSTIPAWINDYKKEGTPQIVAQYFYFDVYAKTFPKGTIVLPDAEEQKNEVNRNYFVMVKKK
jgi:dienelactone hydrolase